MRPIHIVDLDKPRPAVILTRESVRPRRRWVSVAPIKTAAAGLSTEVPVGPRQGLDHASVIDCDSIVTVGTSQVGRQIGLLMDDQEPDLARALSIAFDLEPTG
jgi:mRNA interferase MazF